MTRYRFLDPMGDVVAERQFDDHAGALAWAQLEADEDPELVDAQIERVEYLGPDGDWRWAGVLHG